MRGPERRPPEPRPTVPCARADLGVRRRDLRRPTRRALGRTTWLVVLLGAALVGLGPPQWDLQRSRARHAVTSADLTDGRAALAALSVRRGEGAAGYERERFGQAWADEDRNGCDTRNDLLRRDLAEPVLDPRTHGCVVLRGVLDDPYTGRRVVFDRARAREVQVDHVVALGDAWRSGADGWDDRRRRGFANDPANLLAVDGRTNQDKGAADASTWLPPDRGYACVYVLRQVRVKDAYGLSVTRAERAAMATALDGCVVARAAAPRPTSAVGRTSAAVVGRGVRRR